MENSWGKNFETVIGVTTDEDEENHKHDEHEHEHNEDCEHEEGHQLRLQNILKRFSQANEEHEAHKHKGENQEMEHAGHNHEHEILPEGAEEEEATIAELEPYAHFHDIAEEVTYYDATTSSKLRAALANMWDAELHLRMGNPQKALPYEYRALKLIKQIQQASRIYVERVGFEPPVIKVAEKTLEW